MKESDSHVHVPAKTLLCMMVMLFFAGVFLVGEGVNMAWRQRADQAAVQQAQNSQAQYTAQPAGRMKSHDWKTWHHRRHHHHRFQASNNKHPINADIPMPKFETW